MQKTISSKLVDQFQPGDLLFGLEKEARYQFVDELKLKLKMLHAKHHYVTLDEIVRPLEPYYVYHDQLSMSPVKGESSPVKNHAQVLLSSPCFTDITDQTLSPSSKERSKLLVSCYLAIENYPGMIHFCLDGLDLNKTRHGRKQNHKGYNSYTSSELRYVAINYDQLKHKICFYKHGLRVNPPWITEELSPQEWLQDYREEYAQAESTHQPESIARRNLFLADEEDALTNNDELSMEADLKKMRVEFF